MTLEEVGKIFEEESRASKPLIPTNMVSQPPKLLSTSVPRSSNCSAEWSTSNAIHESDQQELVKELIDERVAVYHKDHQADHTIQYNFKSGTNDLSIHPSLSLLHRTRLSTPTDPEALTQKTTPPSTLATVHSPRANPPSTNGSVQSKKQSTSGGEKDCESIDISYCSALYLVCCPCLGRRETARYSSSEGAERHPFSRLQHIDISPAAYSYGTESRPPVYTHGRNATRHSLLCEPGGLRPLGTSYSWNPAWDLEECLSRPYALGEDAQDLERLLHLWTTLYDASATTKI
ncbi:uncharacterized protein KD926_011602 [Aspergillus affinis]|uniref:uncharacterized protein n=1 Tax=Aspergillus affinis TaxID=1070780 RepID=UPI0022FEAA61|nr:uncharacterized protein KD926_011602 [Aspergillus affinis]KAI9037813.1 hypothetical protein KD926_011602 [Aspergillus affinis]